MSGVLSMYMNNRTGGRLSFLIQSNSVKQILQYNKALSGLCTYSYMQSEIFNKKHFTLTAM